MTTKNKIIKKIRFCEPYTDMISTMSLKSDIDVTNDFMEILKNEPKYVTEKHSNAYIFGKQYALEKYTLIANHMNDVAQTGLVNVTDITENDIEKMNDSHVWNDAYKKLDWDDRESLKKLRKTSDRFLFVGQTMGGDVGAQLYAHRNKSGNIDSLIIDVNCLFLDCDDSNDSNND